MNPPKKYDMVALTPHTPSVDAFHPDWLTFLMPGYRREFPRQDLFAARLGSARLELYMQTRQVITLHDSNPCGLLLEALDNTKVVRLPSQRNFECHTPPSLAAELKRRCAVARQPAGWQLPTPWALLQEFAINLHAVEDMSYSAIEEGKQFCTLILKTYAGPAFRLRVSPITSLDYEAAVRARSTFTCPEVDTIIVPVADQPSSLAPERPDPTPFTSGLEKFKRKFPGH